MSMPLFMPSHLSKYLFPFSASVKLLDRVFVVPGSCSWGFVVCGSVGWRLDNGG